MQVTASTLSLNVPDVDASAAFATRALGFTETMRADGFVALAHPTAALHVALLRTGLDSFRPARISGSAGEGLLVALSVEDLDAEHARILDLLPETGARVETTPETEPWGERYCQYADANGIVWQLVQWVAEPPAETLTG